MVPLARRARGRRTSENPANSAPTARLTHSHVNLSVGFVASFLDRCLRPLGRPPPAQRCLGSFPYLVSFLEAVPVMTYAPPAKSICAFILPSGAGVSRTTASTGLFS